MKKDREPGRKWYGLSWCPLASLRAGQGAGDRWLQLHLLAWGVGPSSHRQLDCSVNLVPAGPHLTARAKV